MAKSIDDQIKAFSSNTSVWDPSQGVKGEVGKKMTKTGNVVPGSVTSALQSFGPATTSLNKGKITARKQVGSNISESMTIDPNDPKWAMGDRLSSIGNKLGMPQVGAMVSSELSPSFWGDTKNLSTMDLGQIQSALSDIQGQKAVAEEKQKAYGAALGLMQDATSTRQKQLAETSGRILGDRQRMLQQQQAVGGMQGQIDQMQQGIAQGAGKRLGEAAGRIRESTGRLGEARDRIQDQMGVIADNRTNLNNLTAGIREKLQAGAQTPEAKEAMELSLKYVRDSQDRANAEMIRLDRMNEEARQGNELARAHAMQASAQAVLGEYAAQERALRQMGFEEGSAEFQQLRGMKSKALGQVQSSVLSEFHAMQEDWDKAFAQISTDSVQKHNMYINFQEQKAVDTHLAAAQINADYELSKIQNLLALEQLKLSNEDRMMALENQMGEVEGQQMGWEDRMGNVEAQAMGWQNQITNLQGLKMQGESVKQGWQDRMQRGEQILGGQQAEMLNWQDNLANWLANFPSTYVSSSGLTSLIADLASY